MIVVVFLLALSFLYQYYHYKKLTAYSLHVSHATLVSHYQKAAKDGKNYEIYKLRDGDIRFFVRNNQKIDAQNADRLKVVFYTKNISFYDYLRGFFTNAKQITIEQKHEPNALVEYIQQQHQDPKIRELYNALYFAMPISKELRASISEWGIAHLVAISGFHLGILSAILYFLLRPSYMFFQDRYFPYRNRNADLAFVVLSILGAYAYFLDFSPSILRAFVMSVLGFLLFSRGIKILSFATLFFTICTVLIFFPTLVFSMAFWLSVAGVFYIFLFLHHYSKLPKIAIFVLLNFWVFVLMLPIVHALFDVFSIMHFLSPLVSMLFMIFYPLSLVLHVVHLGALMDSQLLWFLFVDIEVIKISVSMWLCAFYVLLSLAAIRFWLIASSLPLIALLIVFIQKVA